MDEVRFGKYRHFKGNLYEVVGFAKHSETCEDMVVYRALDQGGGTWVRPKQMWNEQVQADGKVVPRFRYITQGSAKNACVTGCEEVEVLQQTDHVRIERIDSHGVASAANAWYDSDLDEWVCLVKGEAVLELEDGTMLSLQEGQHYTIAAHQKHRVEFTSSDCQWLCVHFKKEV